MKINNGEKEVEIMRNGTQLYPTISRGNAANLNQAIDFQVARIVVEAIILVLDIIGLRIPRIWEKFTILRSK